MPVRAAELPDKMMGGWCFDKLKTRALAAKGEYYHTRTDQPDDCANRGGMAVSKDGPSRIPIWPSERL
jgi:hypothetical protein